MSQSFQEYIKVSPTEEAVISDAQWRTWFEMGKRRDAAAARKKKVAAGIVVSLAAIGSMIYFVAAR